MKVLNVSLMPLFFFTLSFNLLAQRIEADYPLAINLADTTGQNDNVFLQGNNTPPASPSNGNPLCSNGIYLIDPDGQNIQTPVLSEFNINRFQVLVDFNITLLPDVNSSRPRMPVLMGGNFARWLGVYVDSSGFLGIKHNNSNYAWSAVNFNVSEGLWYRAELNYNNGSVDLYIDQTLLLSEQVGSLNTFNDDHNFTVTDFSEGNTFYGCIKNLTVVSFDDLIFAAGFD